MDFIDLLPLVEKSRPPKMLLVLIGIISSTNHEMSITLTTHYRFRGNLLLRQTNLAGDLNSPLSLEKKKIKRIFSFHKTAMDDSFSLQTGHIGVTRRSCLSSVYVIIAGRTSRNLFLCQRLLELSDLWVRSLWEGRKLGLGLVFTVSQRPFYLSSKP